MGHKFVPSDVNSRIACVAPESVELTLRCGEGEWENFSNTTMEIIDEANDLTPGLIDIVTMDEANDRIELQLTTGAAPVILTNWDRHPLRDILSHSLGVPHSGQSWTLKQWNEEPRANHLSPQCRSSPPEFAQKLLRLFLPRSECEPVLGDLEERYRTDWLPDLGKNKSTLRYWKEAAVSVCFYFGPQVCIVFFTALFKWLLGKIGF